MTTYFHDIAEEFEARHMIGDADASLPGTADVLLYHDGEVSGDTTNGDDLTAGSDVGDITTEPDAGTTLYERQTVNIDTTDFNHGTDGSGDHYIEIVATVEFDLSDVDSGTADAYGVVIEWDQDGDAAVEPHLWWTDTLDQAYDLSQHDTFQVDGASLTRSGQNAP